MAYCPECGAEFRVGIRRCPECRVDLVDELEDPNVEDSQEENLVLVHSVTSTEEAKRIKDLLQQNGILCVVEPVKAAATAPGLKVLVNQKDEPRAQELMKLHSG